jgi:hypothetical protein
VAVAIIAIIATTVVIEKSAVTENVKSVVHARTISSASKVKAKIVSKIRIKANAMSKVAIGKIVVDATVVVAVVDVMVAMKGPKAMIVMTPVSRTKTSALIQ